VAFKEGTAKWSRVQLQSYNRNMLRLLRLNWSQKACQSLLWEQAIVSLSWMERTTWLWSRKGDPHFSLESSLTSQWRPTEPIGMHQMHLWLGTLLHQ